MTQFSLFDTLRKNVQPLNTPEKGAVKIYTCGPTVYNNIHIGNIRTYTTADILRRTLTFLGYTVTHVTNITDVDDKTIKGSIAAKMSLKDFTAPYIKSYLEDISKVNIIQPDHSPRATDTKIISGIIDLIQKLLEKKVAYIGDDGVYYSIASFPDYDHLAGTLSVGKSRINNDEYDKESASDFALWKFHSEADGDVYWDAPFGRGRPGWHIECSAMIHEVLGEPIDIHTGGVDLIFPHHTNEIAQTTPIYGTLAHTWMHNEHITVDGQKMSKSLGNTYTIGDIVERGYSPIAYRYLLLGTHYRQKQNFTFEALAGAEQALKNARRQLRSYYSSDASSLSATPDNESLKSFSTALSNDLNTSEALACFWTMLKSTEIDSKTKVATALAMDQVLGLGLREALEPVKVPEEIKALAQKREEARKASDWTTSDLIRKQINDAGFELKDTEYGPVIEAL